MQMITSRLFICIAILSIASCDRGTGFESNKVTSLKVSADTSSLKTIQLKADFSLTQLGDRNCPFISTVSKIFSSRECHIIFDHINNNILVFDKSGNFKRKIGSIGEGEGQFMGVTDVVYYDNRKEIEVFSIQGRKMLTYKLTGELVSERISNFDFLSFFRTEEGYWVYGCFENNRNRSVFNLGNNRFNLLLLSDDLKTIKEEYCESKNFFDRTNNYDNFHLNSKGELLFHYGFSDVIYKLADKKAEPYLFFDFGQKKLPYDFIVNISSQKDFDSEVFFSHLKYSGFKTRFQIGDKLTAFRSKEYSMDPSKTYSFLARQDGSKSLSTPKLTTTDGIDLSMLISIENHKAIFFLNPRLLTRKDVLLIKEKYNIDVLSSSNPLLLITNEDALI